jgi:hypothetical protein
MIIIKYDDAILLLNKVVERIDANYILDLIQREFIDLYKPPQTFEEIMNNDEIKAELRQYIFNS